MQTMYCLFAVLLSVINCVNVTWAARVQNVFLIMKVLALVVISVTGFVWIAQGKKSRQIKDDIRLCVSK